MSARTDEMAGIRSSSAHKIDDLTPVALSGATSTRNWVAIPAGNIPGGVDVILSSDGGATAQVQIEYANSSQAAKGVKGAMSNPAALDQTGAAAPELQSPGDHWGITPLTGFSFMALVRLDAGTGTITGTVSWACAK